MRYANSLHLTYRQIRLLAAASLILVPVLIILIAWLRDQVILPTLSHYYFAESVPGLLRTMFTGFLILVGGIMLAYRGFDDKDNIVHNIAGILAICVALFPKRCDMDDIACVHTPFWLLHMPSAVALFFTAAYATWYSGGPNLQRRLNKDENRKLYLGKWIAIAGMLSGLLAYLPFIFGGKAFFPTTGVLIVELTGFFSFAFYWSAMTFVIYRANLRLTSVARASSKSCVESRSEVLGLSAETAIEHMADNVIDFIP